MTRRLIGLINGQEYPIQYKPDGSGFEFRTSGFYFQKDLAHIASNIPNGADITPNVTNPILADGTPDQLVITINNDYVGPTLIVPEGAFVAVKVVNMLENQQLLLHFHGMHQKGSWAYDGSRTTQCPIHRVIWWALDNPKFGTSRKTQDYMRYYQIFTFQAM